MLHPYFQRHYGRCEDIRGQLFNTQIKMINTEEEVLKFVCSYMLAPVEGDPRQYLHT